MNQQAILYAHNQRVGVLAVEMPNGSPHGATMHFAADGDATHFYFRTSPHYRKAEALQQNNTCRATLVIGVDENDMKSMQMDGIARACRADEMQTFNSIFLKKFAEKQEKPDELAFVFIPTWWRFADWTGAEGKQVWEGTTQN